MGQSQKISVDRRIKVVYGNEAFHRSPYSEHQKNVRATVLYISGNLDKLTVNISNVMIETVIFGYVREVEVSNCLSVKGTVKNATVGNVISSTQGKSCAISTEKLVADRKKREEEFFNNAKFMFDNK